MYGAEDANHYYDLMVRLSRRKDTLTWTELENMTPMEKDIYLDYYIMLINEEDNGKQMAESPVIEYSDYRNDMEGQ